MKYCILFLSAVIFMVVSCKKVETPKFHEDTLEAGKWKVAHVVKKTKLADTVMYLDTLTRTTADSLCKSDDYLEFKMNNSGVLKTGAIKCQAEIDEVPFRWGITENDKKIYIYQAGEMFYGNNDVSGDLKNFSDNQFVIDYYTISNVAGGKIDTIWYTALVKKF